MTARSFLSIFVAGALGACGDDNPNPGKPQPDAGVMPDARPVDVPLEREHAGGSPNAIELVGTRAYIGVGPRLAIWDLAKTPPSLVGESAPLPGVINALAVSGTRAYVAQRVNFDSTIHVFDVSVPSSPVHIHAFTVASGGGGSVIRDLEVGPARLYVSDQEQGVVELDLADPDHPAKLQVVPPLGVDRLALVGPRLYYTMAGFIGGASVGALDTANGLADLGSGPVGNIDGIAFADKLAIGAGPDGIYVYDVGDPANPVERFHRGAPDMGPFARAIATRGSTAWIPAHDGLHTLDLTDPTSIGHTGPMAVATANANAAASSATTVAIVTDRGRLLAFDLTTPQRGPAIADVTVCADCVGVDVADATVYIADIVGGVRTASLASLAHLGRSAALPEVPNAGGLQFVFADVDVAGSHAYVADWLYGLRVFDVTTVHAQLAGSVVTGGAPSAVRVVGDRAYVAEGTGGGRLSVVDVSNPAHPVYLGGISTTKAMDVEVRGTIAYVADGSFLGTPGGLRMLNIANPAAITELGLYQTGCKDAHDVALLDDIAIVACTADGFHWVDISNPSSPTRVAVTTPAHASASAFSVATWAGHAALGHDRGVIVISAGSVPQTVATFATAWPVYAITVPTPGRLVAAAGLGGVYQWQVPAQ